ncbi:hypothetical protein GOQ27_14005 [Clostridium sp. D2Q-11]|uniref:Exo-alpha-sialidase n=1 Tax=Anaeromonas frigoriresistens TaxID=2683708 RepID=A0A942UUZ0_9FIRM|nr:hypothetical protein [Anaeromonas frigoriresistens]MBS4539583.1 hypothetical protein [Anaeromonas frigoriresistens]
MEQKKKIYKIGLIIFITIAIISIGYYSYYKYQQNKLVYQPPEGFTVETDTSDITKVGEKWLEEYIKQYQRDYVPRKKKITEYTVDSIEIKEDNIVQITFDIVPKEIDEMTASNWNGVIEDNKIRSQWVLWFEEGSYTDGDFIYTLSKLQRPAGYDLEKYNTSGEKEKDEYEQEYIAEIPYEKEQYTYKIEDGICYVSYDEGSSWKEVPILLETLVKVGDGREHYNKLQEGSYIITPEKTAFVYGGNRESNLKIIYSEDRGNTWQTSVINQTLKSNRVKFVSFPTPTTGYVIATGERTMSQEMQTIYKTKDGGITWTKVGNGPWTWLLHSVGFIDENIGFIIYQETNFYRTEDGGKTFEPIILPVHEVEYMDNTYEPFIQPETPYMEDGELFLLVGQGPEGDIMGGRVKAKYKSEDKGKTWNFVELVEPPSDEIG